jgi:membrane associated rhomboid family serine protease
VLQGGPQHRFRAWLRSTGRLIRPSMPCVCAVYRILTAVVVHAGLLHVAFNMLAFVPMGASLERLVGTIQVGAEHAAWHCAAKRAP